MAAEWQNSPDADIVLRASGGKEFYAHKLVLSLASPVFRDMFSVPRPSGESSQTPIVDVSDPPEVLEMFLQFIYPFRNPSIDGVETLASLLRLADKYHAKVALDAYKDYLPSMWTNPLPIHIYAVMCACGREEEALTAARRVSFASLEHLNSSPLLHLMTVEHYQRLAMFMIARDRRIREIVSRHQKHIAVDYTARCDPHAHALYASYIVAPIQAAFKADPCVRVVEALGLVASDTHAFTLCSYAGCKFRCDLGVLRGYGEGLLKELVEMAENLPWAD